MLRETLFAGDSQQSPDFAGLVLVMRRFGIFALGGTDGCLCSHFKFRCISVDISCYESEGGNLPEALAPEPGFWGMCVRVRSKYLDARLSECIPPAEEIVRQIHEIRPDLPVFVRLCSYSSDHDKAKPKGACLYCGAERDKLSDYLCRDCKTQKGPWGEDVAEEYTLPESWTGVFRAKEKEIE